MPTYQYRCRDCDHTFEAVQSMRDEPLTVCPSCGGTLRKVYAPPAIAFKGSGFYATDHGKRKPASTTTETGADGSKPAKPAPDAAKGKDRAAGSAGRDGGSTTPPAKETAST